MLNFRKSAELTKLTLCSVNILKIVNLIVLWRTALFVALFDREFSPEFQDFPQISQRILGISLSLEISPIHPKKINQDAFILKQF